MSTHLRKGAPATSAGSARRAVASGREVALALALAVAAAVLLNVLAARHPLRADWTAARRHSLDERTLAAVARLSTPVTLRAVVALPAAPETPDERLAAAVWPELEALLGALRRAAPGRLQVEVLDALRDPPVARAALAAAGVRLPNVVLVTGGAKAHGGKADAAGEGATDEAAKVAGPTNEAPKGDGVARRVVGFERLAGEVGPGGQPSFRGEQALLGAILAVSAPRRPLIHFSRGHGERALEEGGSEGLSRLTARLGEEGYEVRPAPLDTAAPLPEDARLLVLAGPRAPLSAEATARVEQFVARGGALLALLDPVFGPRGLQPTGLEALLAKRGLRLGDALLHDPAGAFPAAPTHTFLVRERGAHGLLRGLRGETLFVAGPREVTGGEALWWTSSRAQAAADPASPPEGAPARRALAAAVPRGRSGAGPLVVVGDSDLGSNGQLDTAADGAFLLRAVDWLLGDEARLALPERAVATGGARLTSRELRLAFWLFVLVLPAGAATVGVGLLVARRRRS